VRASERGVTFLELIATAAILAILDRFPLVVWAGAALLGFVAGEMFMTDIALVEKVGESVAHHWEMPVALFAAALVVVVGWFLTRTANQKDAEEKA